MRPLKFVLLVLLGAVLMHGCFAVFAAACAHAATVVSTDVPMGVTPHEARLPIEAWIALAVAAGGGLVMMLRGLAELVGIVARRTATKKDDAVYERLDGFVDTLEEVLGLLRGVRSGTVVNVTPVVAPTDPPRDPQAGRARLSLTGGMAALAIGVVLGSTGYLTLTGCGARQRAAAGAQAFLDCQTENLAGAVAELVPLAKQAVMVAIGGTGHVDFMQLRAAAAPLKSDLGRCALAAAIAALATPAPAQPGAPAAAPLVVDGAELRAAFVAIRGELGWPAVKTSAGVL